MIESQSAIVESIRGVAVLIGANWKRRIAYGALTLFALAHPIARERRGSVIVSGGHGGRTIDIIPCAGRPRLCILLDQLRPGHSGHHARWLPRVKGHSMRGKAKKFGKSRTAGSGLVEPHVDAEKVYYVTGKTLGRSYNEVEEH